METKWRDRLLGFFIVGFFVVSLLGTISVIDARKLWKEEISIRYAAQVQTGKWKQAYEECSRTDTMPIIMRLQSRLDPILAREIAVAIQKYSSEYRLPPELIIHIIDRESRFRPLAKSKACAVGLMQIMTKAHKDKLKKMNITAEEAYHIDNNIKLGCWIFREYFDSQKDIEKTLKKYVGGNHETYVKDILRAFTNEAIVGVKDVQGMREIEERERGTEDQGEHERSGEPEKEIINSPSGDQSG